MLNENLTISLYNVKVFSTNPKLGNAAGVILNADTLSETQMQSIAKEVGASETAFIFPSDLADFKIRWFTPTNEVGICIHATIGALGTLKLLNKLLEDVVEIETINGILKARLIDEKWFIFMNQYLNSKNEVNIDFLTQALEIQAQDLENKPGIIAIFDDHELVIQVKSLAILKNLKPSMEGYAEICKKLNVTGISIFTTETFDANYSLHTREFAPLYGYLEDPLCGMASGCIVTYLKGNILPKIIRVEQGHFANTSGLIEIIPSKEGLWIGGSHIICRTSKLKLTSIQRIF